MHKAQDYPYHQPSNQNLHLVLVVLVLLIVTIFIKIIKSRSCVEPCPCGQSLQRRVLQSPFQQRDAPSMTLVIVMMMTIVMMLMMMMPTMTIVMMMTIASYFITVIIIINHYNHHHKNLLLGVTKGVNLPGYCRDRTLAKSIRLQLHTLPCNIFNRMKRTKF